MPPITAPLSFHLNEVKTHSVYILISFLASFTIAYSQAEHFLTFFTEPLATANGDWKFVFTDVSEAFTSQVYLALLVAICVTTPQAAYRIWYFLVPGLLPSEKSLLTQLCTLAIALQVSALACTRYYFAPTVYTFLLSFKLNNPSGLELNLLARISEFIELTTGLTVATTVLFQAPTLLYALVHLQLVELSSLMQRRNISYLAILILATLISPPDPLSQFVVALPAATLYEITLLTICFNKAYKNPKNNTDIMW